MIDLMAFPMEVLTLIIMLVSDETELSKLSFIKRNIVKNATEKNLTLISPKTICILSRVCKSFRTEFISNIYWIPLMVRDFRKGVEYKRPHKNCRKVYMEKLVLRDIKPKLRIYNNILSWNQEQLKIRNHNSNIYLKEIQKAVTSPYFDNIMHKYKVTGLQTLNIIEPTYSKVHNNSNYAENLISNIQFDLNRNVNFYTLYTWRNNHLDTIVYSNQRINEMQGNIEKCQKIVSGIELM